MSSEQFTFAGVPLIVPSAQILSFVEDHGQFKPESYFRIPNNGKLDGQDIYFDNYDRDPYRHMKLGSLYWPTGASNFAAGFFLITSSDLEKLPGYDTLGFTDSLDTKGGLRSTISKEEYKAGKLVMQNTDIPFSAKMYMLPPRPLIQIVTPAYNDNVQLRGKIPMSHLEALWVLPLVDERYWWWWHTSGEMSLKTCTSWQGLFVSLFKNMGYDLHQLLISEIPSKYLYPNKVFRSQYSSLKVPLLLDTIAHSCNSRIISKFNGQLLVEHVREGYELDSYTSITPAGVAAGGYMSLHSTVKENYEKQFPASSPLNKSSTAADKLVNVIRDTPGVIPAVTTFIVNNKKIHIDVIGKSETSEDYAKRDANVWPLSDNGYDTLNTQSIETIATDGSLDSITKGVLGYFTSTEGDTVSPSISSYQIKGRGAVVTDVPYKDGDFLLDTRTGTRYGPRLSGSWGDGVNGVSVLSKYFRINASSYKTNVKQCPVESQKPANKTDKEFNDNQLKEYAQTYAGDWALFQLSDTDITLNGCVPIQQTSLIGHIEFNITEGGSFTRIVRPPYNDTVQDLYIESYLGDESGCDADTYACGQCKGMQAGSVTTQLYGFGNSSMFLPYSPVQVKNSTLPVGADPLLYTNYHKPPYVVKFCLGSSVGNVALDYHFQTQAMVSVYWNGSKVTSRQINGGKSFTCAGCAQCWGRLTFAKTAKTPSYATVIIERVNEYDTDAQLLQNQNWYMNMRCVDSQPYPAPRAIACDQKLDEVGGIFTLGMFTSIPINIPSSSNGIIPNTSVCVADAAESTFQCGGGNCTIPANLIMSFENPPDSCKYLKDTVIPLQQSVFDGGWAGIHDQFGPLKDIVQAKLTLVGNSGFNLTIKDIVNVSKTPVQLTSGTTCICTPFKLEFAAGILTPFSCVGTTTKVIIKEA